jgi:hypothetical protein
MYTRSWFIIYRSPRWWIVMNKEYQYLCHFLHVSRLPMKLRVNFDQNYSKCFISDYWSKMQFQLTISFCCRKRIQFDFPYPRQDGMWKDRPNSLFQIVISITRQFGWLDALLVLLSKNYLRVFAHRNRKQNVWRCDLFHTSSTSTNCEQRAMKKLFYTCTSFQTQITNVMPSLFRNTA